MKPRIKLYVNKLLFLTGILTIILAGCNRLMQSATGFPDVGIPFDEMNRDLYLSAPEGWNSYKVDDVVHLNVEVKSDYSIEFPNDYGVLIYQLDQNNWIEVENIVNYLEGDIVLYPTEGDPFRAGNPIFYPELDKVNGQTRIRIIIIGNIIRDGVVTEEKTGGYIDLTLKP